MATTTPNFGWPVPTSTDLVKDGAVAIEALGDAVDASLLDLKGGTTGQVLAKATNTDMDFAWVANDVGDITAVTAGTGLTGGGTTGAVSLAFDQANFGGGQGAAGKNGVLNSAFQVFQRGVSVAVAASTSPYVADRWQASVQANQACTYSQQSTNDTTNLPFIQNCIRVQRNSGQTGTGTINLAQSFETINSRQFSGKQVTLSFYARKGANYSQAGDGMGAYVYTGTGTDQNVISGYTAGAIPLSVSGVQLTATWQRFQATATLGATITELGVRFQYDPTGTAGAADYYEVTGVQLEVGSVATPFKTYGATIQGETSACQRYYFRQSADATSTYSLFGTGYASSSTVGVGLVKLPITMRTTPTTLETGGTVAFFNYANTGYNGSAFAIDSGVSNANVVKVTFTISGATAGHTGVFVASNSSTAYVGLGAEL